MSVDTVAPALPDWVPTLGLQPGDEVAVFHGPYGKAESSNSGRSASIVLAHLCQDFSEAAADDQLLAVLKAKSEDRQWASLALCLLG